PRSVQGHGARRPACAPDSDNAGIRSLLEASRTVCCALRGYTLGPPEQLPPGGAKCFERLYCHCSRFSSRVRPATNILRTDTPSPDYSHCPPCDPDCQRSSDGRSQLLQRAACASTTDEACRP